MLIAMICLLVLAAVVLAWSADRFVHASITLARRWHWPPVVIGVVLVGFGTSFPELIVSLMASLQGKGVMAVGNVVGSNIANLTLVLGLAVCLFPVAVAPRLYRQDVPVLLLLCVVIGIFLCVFGLSWPTLLCLFAGLMLMLYGAMRHKSDVPAQPAPAPQQALWLQIAAWFGGLLLLFVSAEAFVRAAVFIARSFGMSELLIGLTVVTLGTSLPEVAATLASARRGEHDVAIGHLIGSNIFNICAVLAMPALLSDVSMPALLLHRDYIWMLVVTALLWLALWVCRRKAYLPRSLGVIFLALYAAYMAVLVVTA